VERDAPDVDRLGDVLDPVLAHRLEGKRELVADVIVDRARDADPARLGQTFQAGGDVDAVAQDVTVFDNDIAQVDADAERDAPVRSLRRLALGDGFLDRYRAFDGVDRARELDQRAVAHQLHDATAMLRDQRLDQLFAQRPQAGNGAGPVGAHEPTVAHHVGGQNRRQPTFRARRHAPASTGVAPIGDTSTLARSRGKIDPDRARRPATQTPPPPPGR
jgi:hypothetical protein